MRQHQFQQDPAKLVVVQEHVVRPFQPETAYALSAGGAVRAVVEAAGIKDIRTKCLRSNNPINVTAATFAGLCGLTDAESVAAKRGKTVAEILG